MKVTTSGISASSVTSKTARTGTPSQAQKRSKTLGSLSTPSEIPSSLLNTQRLKIAHSNLPPGFALTFKECLILLYVEQHRNQAYDQWPQELRQTGAVERLRRRRYLRRSYFPTSYNVTKQGYSLVKWIQSSLEHAAAIVTA